MAKISRSAVEKKIIYNSQDGHQPTSSEIGEAMIKKFKKDTKREQILDYCRLHQYHLSKKERRLAKQKMNSVKF